MATAREDVLVITLFTGPFVLLSTLKPGGLRPGNEVTQGCT